MSLLRRVGWVTRLMVCPVLASVSSCTSSSGPPGGTDAGFTGPDGTMFGDGEADSAIEAGQDGSPGMDSTADTSPPVDSGTLDVASEAEAAAPACNPTSPFGTPTVVPYPVDPTAIDFALRMPPDLLTMYLMRSTTGFFQIYTGTRASTAVAFGAVSLLPGVAFGTSNMEKPTVTGDQLTLYLDSDVPPDDAGTGGQHIWMFTRASTAADFASAGEVDLGAPGSDDICPYVTADGNTMYFSSDRAGAIDAYVVTRGDGGTWGTPQSLSTINSPGAITFDLSPSADGLTMYFSSNRSGEAGVNDGTNDLWATRRATTSDPWDAPVHVDELSTPGFDEPTWTSADGCTVFFSSAGPFGDAAATSQVIYQSTRGH